MTLRDVVNKVSTYFSNNSVYTPWIKFTAGGLSINTADRDTNFFMSMENKKNGSGQANTFSISIAFVPNIGGDCNYIDNLLGLEKINESDQGLPKCTLRYGYSELGLTSPQYEGKLTDYSVEIRDGMLYYTLTGYSSIVAFKEDSTLPTKTYGHIEEDESGTQTIVDGERPTVIAKEALEEFFSGVDESLRYKVVIDPSALGKDKKICVSVVTGNTIFEYVDDILNQAIDEDSVMFNNEITKSVYYYVISDEDNDRKITIMRSNPYDSTISNANITFDWMGGFGHSGSSNSSNIVQGFTTEYKGVMSLAARSLTSRSEAEISRTYIDSRGELKTVTSYHGDVETSGISVESDNVVNKSEWSKATQYSYKAKLTTVGLPCELPIGEHVNVNALIYGSRHHTSGKYMIIGSQDIIDSNGFQTSIDLVKIPGK